MAMDAIVRVSLQAAGKDLQIQDAVYLALLGDKNPQLGEGPFEKPGTNLFTCHQGEDKDVMRAIRQLVNTADKYSTWVDFLSITVAKTR